MSECLFTLLCLIALHVLIVNGDVRLVLAVVSVVHGSVVVVALLLLRGCRVVLEYVEVVRLCSYYCSYDSWSR